MKLTKIIPKTNPITPHKTATEVFRSLVLRIGLSGLPKGLKKYPANADYWFTLSRILEKRGKHDEGVETARRSISLSKDVPYPHRRRLADALASTKQFCEAETNFKLLLEDHECAACWFAYAKLLMKLDRSGDAIKAIEEAESMNHDKVVPSERLAKLRSKLLKSNAGIKSEDEQ